MFNLNRPVVNYFGVGYEYKEHSNSGLSQDEIKEWKEKRRIAHRELKALGFKFELDARDKATAKKYALEWNAKYKSDPILGELQVYEYSYL